MLAMKQKNPVHQPIDQILHRLDESKRVKRDPAAVSLDNLGELVNRHPDQALYILRRWMYSQD